MNLLTIGDYYRNATVRVVEALTSLHRAVLPGLGGGADHRPGPGLQRGVGGAMSQGGNRGMMDRRRVVLIYTMFGGMWSVAITDFLQMIIIVVGMLYIGWDVSSMAGGVGTVVQHAVEPASSNFWPDATLAGMLGFVAAGITMMLGSIPQQDVFQRVMSSAQGREDGHARHR
jgi:SSS family solute:Na+ symporter